MGAGRREPGEPSRPPGWRTASSSRRCRRARLPSARPLPPEAPWLTARAYHVAESGKSMTLLRCHHRQGSALWGGGSGGGPLSPMKLQGSAHGRLTGGGWSAPGPVVPRASRPSASEHTFHTTQGLTCTISHKHMLLTKKPAQAQSTCDRHPVR